MQQKFQNLVNAPIILIHFIKALAKTIGQFYYATVKALCGTHPKTPPVAIEFGGITPRLK